MPKKLIDFSKSSTLTPVQLDLEHSGVIRRIKPSNNNLKQPLNYIYDTNTNNIKSESNTNNTKKRFSCDELEVLKERFVDFIKLDQNIQQQHQQPSATLTSTESSHKILLKQDTQEEEANTTNIYDSFLLPSTSSSNLNKHSLIDNSINPIQQLQQQTAESLSINTINTNNNSKIMENNYQHLPLPEPPPQFLLSSSSQDDQKNITTNTTPPMQIPNLRSYLSSRLSVISTSESTSGADYSLSSSSSSSTTSSTTATSKPEPPQRTVSIRNSASTNFSILMDNLSINNDYSRPIRLSNNLIANKEDCISIKSNTIYSTYRPANTIARSSRSVFSIYEEEDETSSGCPGSTLSTSSSSSSSTSPYSNLPSIIRLERLNDYDTKRIESMYRSIGSLVHVSSCTCDLYTTTSEQIANLLNDCWNLEQNSIVPVWLFDTGLNPKRPKQLRLLFVDKQTAFPYQSLNQTPSQIIQPVLINSTNRIKNPNCNDKRLTFTLNNKQLICLIQFNDLFSCKEFFKFYSDLETNPRHFQLFNESSLLYEDLLQQQQSTRSTNRFKSMSFRRKVNQSQSMLTLSRTSDSLNRYSLNRYSDDNNETINKNNSSKFYKLNAGSLTTGNLNQHLNEMDVRITGITKNCISNPCAFQHISTLKNDDHRIRLLIENNNKNKKL